MYKSFNNNKQSLDISDEIDSNGQSLPTETIDRLERLITETNSNNYFVNLAVTYLGFNDPEKEDCWALSLVSDHLYTEHSILPLFDHEKELEAYEEAVKSYYQFRDNLSQLPVLKNEVKGQLTWLLRKEDGVFVISIHEHNDSDTCHAVDKVVINQPEDLFNEDVQRSLINLQTKFDELASDNQLVSSDLDGLSNSLENAPYML